MKKYGVIVFLFFCSTETLLALDLPFPGRLVQQFSHSIISVDATSYYQNSGVVHPLEYLPKEDRERVVDEIFTFQSRTAYLSDYFAVMFDYTLLERNKRFFNSILSEKKEKLLTKISHQISPSIFAIYNPMRIGLSYHHEFGEKVDNFQELTLRPAEALSLHIGLFFHKIPKTAMGVGLFYQYAFNPLLTPEEIAKMYFQKAGLSLHIYFAYYLHFRLAATWERLEEPFSAQRVIIAEKADAGVGAVGDADVVTIYLKQRTRYMLQYDIIYSFSEELSLFATIAQVVYANFESPDFRFRIGVNLNFGNDDN